MRPAHDEMPPMTVMESNIQPRMVVFVKTLVPLVSWWLVRPDVLQEDAGGDGYVE